MKKFIITEKLSANLKNNNSKFINTLAKLNGSLELENVPDNENCLEEYEFIILDEDED